MVDYFFYNLFKYFLSESFRMRLRYIRCKKLSTMIFGPQFTPNHYKIEIDITYSCNLHCYDCNRSCSQAPSQDSMTIEQIEKFVIESVERKRKWHQITLLGGEPTLHPDLRSFVRLLLEYKNNFSPHSKIGIVSNSFGSEVKDVLLGLPKGILIYNTSKVSNEQRNFYAFNFAPVDFNEYNCIDFINACSVTARCGIGLNKYGYYCCAIGGGIDRVIGLDIGKKFLPNSGDTMFEQVKSLCKYCGRFKLARKEDCQGPGNRISGSWENFYKKFNENKPLLSVY